jgi:thiamine-phosphate pyrophosphorylase
LLLYYITDRTQFPGDEAARYERLREKVAEAARCGVDFVQLREKDLTARQLEWLARDCLKVIRKNSEPGTRKRDRTTAFLINSRTDVAVAVDADGVHLRSGDISAPEVRAVWHQQKIPPIIGVSCHTPAEVAQAAVEGAGFAVFAPVFEKSTDPNSSPAGLDQLRLACQSKLPVLALGGVTLDNAAACVAAGAAGVAGIRLFQENPISEVVDRLRSPSQ